MTEADLDLIECVVERAVKRVLGRAFLWIAAGMIVGQVIVWALT